MKMKTYSIIGLIAIMAFSLTSCGEEPLDLSRGVGVVPIISNLNPAVFDGFEKPTTFVKFTVDMPAGASVTSTTVVASLNGNQARGEVTSITTFPSDVTITLAQVATALGTSLDNLDFGDVINFELVTVKGGKSYYSEASFNSAVVCGYNVALVTGVFQAVAPTWGINFPVTITVDPTDQYTLYVAGLAANDGLVETGPMKMVINPLNFNVTVPTSILSPDLGPWGLAIYTDYQFAGSGLLSSCDGRFTLDINICVAQGCFGGNPHRFTLTKL